MKKTVILGIISFFSTFSFSQNKWELLESDLWKQKENKVITLDEWYSKLQIEAGSIPNRLTAWYKGTSKILDFSDYGISLFFVNKNLKISDNGNVYREMKLQNDSSDSLIIKRIDATIGDLQEFFY